MAWTYNTNLATDKDKVRFLIGDTNASDQLLSDEELNALLGIYVGVYPTAAAACDGLASRFARDVDYSNMSLSVSASQRVEQYKRTASQLRQMASRAALPRSMAATKADKESLAQDDSLVEPVFRIGEDDYFTPTDPNPQG